MHLLQKGYIFKHLAKKRRKNVSLQIFDNERLIALVVTMKPSSAHPRKKRNGSCKSILLSLMQKRFKGTVEWNDFLPKQSLLVSIESI
jgi:hypothetical protein